MKIRTSELTGLALTWAYLMAETGSTNPQYVPSRNALSRLAAKARGLTDEKIAERFNGEDFQVFVADNGFEEFLAPLYWGDVGTIIEREQIDLRWVNGYWEATIKRPCGAGMLWHTQLIGDTPLIAAMRCFVHAELGEEVEIPDALLED